MSSFEIAKEIGQSSAAVEDGIRWGMLQLFAIESAKPTLKEVSLPTADSHPLLGMCVSARIFPPSGAISWRVPLENTFRHLGSGQQPSS
jgi:hypothetical protein